MTEASLDITHGYLASILGQITVLKLLIFKYENEMSGLGLTQEKADVIEAIDAFNEKWARK